MNRMLLTIDHGPIRELRLNRPPVNALSPDLIVTLRQAVESAPRDGIRALILSGSPGRFSAGLDVPLLITFDRAAIADLWRALYALLRALASSPIPIAAAITGHAPAGGTVLPLFCDWRIMAREDYKIGLSEAQVGLMLPPVILAALRRQIGPRHAEHLAVSGLLMSPEQALAIGLVDELSAPDQVVPRALAWCQSLLAVPPQAMTATRLHARADLVALFGSAVESELEAVTAAWWNPSTQATLRALVEKLGKKNG
jgi:Delta3-Delta2-enoyl-CoA isomerase